MAIPTEKQVTIRFLEVMGDHVGPGQRWRFKKEFAKEMNMLAQELHKIEKGLGQVQYRNLIALHILTHANLNWIIAGTGEKYLSEEQTDFTSRIEKLEKAIATLETKQHSRSTDKW